MIKLNKLVELDGLKRYLPFQLNQPSQPINLINYSFPNPKTANRGEVLQTVRQRIIELLTEGEMDARELSREVGIREKEVCDHLAHIARSLAVKGKKLSIQPAQCVSCGYVFKDRQRYTRPGRCPRCKKSHLQSPAFYID
jgi:predicted Zn-ribbon and HTH transcriptional regulator